jgi:8-amino-7-oxononanoate synthase
MHLMERFQPLLELYRTVRATGSDPLGVILERTISPTEAIINGRPTILAGTNNYLGLTRDPECIEAAVQALRLEGTGTTGSRIANGTYPYHRHLEQELADFFGRAKALVFSTGYQANLGTISALAGQHDFVLIDRDCHASIYDACRLSLASTIRFTHNDPDSLKRRLAALNDRRGVKLVVVEGIYSILGDRAPLVELVKVARSYHATILVDEAHSFGVLGTYGRGLCEEQGVEEEVDFIVGTFSKSAGTIGGFCVSNLEACDTFRITSRPFMFTASLPPPIVAAASVALKIIRSRPELRAKLWANVELVYNGLRAMGFIVGPDPSPIIAVRMPDLFSGLAFWRALLNEGVYVNLAVPPATPQGRTVLRCSVLAVHSTEQLLAVLGAFRRVREGLLESNGLGGPDL